MAIFQLRTIDGSFFFKGHFYFYFCVPLIIGPCQSLFLLWERCVASMPRPCPSLSPWPPPIIVCYLAFSTPQLHPCRASNLLVMQTGPPKYSTANATSARHIQPMGWRQRAIGGSRGT